MVKRQATLPAGALRGKIDWKRALLLAVLGALLLVLLATAFLGAGRLGRWYGDVSVRFSQPVSGAAALAARRHAADSEKEDGFWPTFWSEADENLESELFSAEAHALYYAGRGEKVLPVDFLTGGWPGDGGEGCVLSDALAYRLWGGSDVVGKTVRIGGKSYPVSGVFADSEELALLSVGDEGCAPGWQALELAGGGGQPTKTEAEEFLTAAGLGEAESLLVGWWVPLLARALLALPLLVAAVGGLITLLRLAKSSGEWLWFAALFGLLFVLALLLPTLLSLLPDRLLPGKWSDFAFWVALWDDAMAGVRGFLSMGRTLRDLSGRLLVMGQLAVSAALLVLSVFIGWRISSFPKEESDLKREKDKKEAA